MNETELKMVAYLQSLLDMVRGAKANGFDEASYYLDKFWDCAAMLTAITGREVTFHQWKVVCSASYPHLKTV